MSSPRKYPLDIKTSSGSWDSENPLCNKNCTCNISLKQFLALQCIAVHVLTHRYTINYHSKSLSWVNLIALILVNTIVRGYDHFFSLHSYIISSSQGTCFQLAYVALCRLLLQIQARACLPGFHAVRCCCTSKRNLEGSSKELCSAVGAFKNGFIKEHAFYICALRISVGFSVMGHFMLQRRLKTLFQE